MARSVSTTRSAEGRFEGSRCQHARSKLAYLRGQVGGSGGVSPLHPTRMTSSMKPASSNGTYMVVVEPIKVYLKEEEEARHATSLK